jgi:hypothetical protein
VLKLFATERRNDFSAQAIAGFLESPEHYPAEEVSELLDELRASGDYERIIGEV